MMKNVLLPGLLFLLTVSSAYTQTAGSTSYSNSVKVDADFVDMQYRYPNFQNGEVFYRDGQKGTGLLNYQMLVKEIHFINAKGDTLALVDLPTVKQLTIGSDTFFYDKGLLQILGNYNKVKLALKETLRVADRQKTGAYGIKSSTSSIDSYNSLRVNQGTYGLSVAETIIFAKDKMFYLQIKGSLLLPVNWNNMAKAFPSKRNSMQDFASKNHIDLNKEEDLKKLLTFCSKE
jgi:hypothetical protein